MQNFLKEGVKADVVYLHKLPTCRAHFIVGGLPGRPYFIAVIYL
jgi:hypothetical protein